MAAPKKRRNLTRKRVRFFAKYNQKYSSMLNSIIDCKVCKLRHINHFCKHHAINKTSK